MESADNVCSVCHEVVEIFALGKCDHPICFKCSTRMRALCQQFYCPICRTDLPEVFFITTREKFDEMPVRKFISNRKLKIQFENNHVREQFEQLLEHKCSLCPDRYPEKSFRALREHMRRVHTRFFCDLCLELKIFTSERKVYNRQDLATHRRVGDKDDTSYKGHPLCHFCEERYLDKDELYKHLRKEHFYCHFCESLGSQEFYDNYSTLKDHFKTDHYLCEEGDCADVQFTNAFRSDIDLKSHMVEHHSRAQTKSQARQERTLNIDINLVPRATNRPARGGRDEYEGRRGSGPRHQGGRGAGPSANKTARYTTPNARERVDIDRAIQASLSTMKEEDMKKDRPKKGSDSSSSEEEFAQTEENFPTLGVLTSQPQVTTSAASTTVTKTATGSTASKPSLADRFAMGTNQSVQHGMLDDFPTLSQPSNKSEPIKSATSGAKKSNSYTKAPLIKEDFPELPTSSKPSVPVNTNWTKPARPKHEQEKPPKKAQSAGNLPGKSKYKISDNDFPTLGAPTNSSSNWFKPTTKPVTDNKTSKINNSTSDNTCNADIRERFSPVNVPDSPKVEQKSKTKKKKKKDKVSEIKEEKSGSLKSNSSLDDIASLLMTTTVNSEEPEKPEKPIISELKGKKKEDKVEKKLESKKPEPESKIHVNIPEVEYKLKEVELKPVTEAAAQDPPKEVFKPKPKFAIAENDFPALGSGSQSGAGKQSKNPPPGFSGGSTSTLSSTSSKAPPPGLGQNSFRPPPGFMGSQNGFTDTASITNNLVSYQYSQPEDFKERNQMLIATIQSICDTEYEQFNDFKKLSGEFRRADIDASEYYHKCEEVLGKKNFDSVFSELLALLPDIDKQKELFEVHLQQLKKDQNVLKISGKHRDAKGAWTPSNSGFLACQTCEQILVRRDYNQHLSGHNLDSDFPSLSDARSGNQGYTSGAWAKAK